MPGSWCRGIEVREKAEMIPGGQWDHPEIGNSGQLLSSRAGGMKVVVLPEPRCELDPQIRRSHHQRHDSKQKMEGRNPGMWSRHGGYPGTEQSRGGLCEPRPDSQHRAGQWKVGPSKVS